jgi:uncharacterized protein (DUF2147 family)
MKKLFSLVLFVSLTFSTTFAGEGDQITSGIWWTQEKDSKVQFFKSGDLYSGKIVWIKDPLDKNGKPKIDNNNPDEKLKGRPILGMVFLVSFKYEGENVYKDGKIYDPRNGKTYSCKMTFKGKEIDVRGYIGSPMFGKTVTFTKAE